MYQVLLFKFRRHLCKGSMRVNQSLKHPLHQDFSTLIEYIQFFCTSNATYSLAENTPVQQLLKHNLQIPQNLPKLTLKGKYESKL